MGCLFLTAADIRSVIGAPPGAGSSKPKKTAGDLDLLYDALAEVLSLIARGGRWSTSELYHHSPASQRRWPNGVEQGRKAIRQNLVNHAERFCIRKTADGLFIRKGL